MKRSEHLDRELNIEWSTRSSRTVFGVHVSQPNNIEADRQNDQSVSHHCPEHKYSRLPLLLLIRLATHRRNRRQRQNRVPRFLAGLVDSEPRGPGHGFHHHESVNVRISRSCQSVSLVAFFPFLVIITPHIFSPFVSIFALAHSRCLATNCIRALSWLSSIAHTYHSVITRKINMGYADYVHHLYRAYL
jgi:hypothetical protein